MGNKASTEKVPKVFPKTVMSEDHQNLKFGVCHMKGWRRYMEDASIHTSNFSKRNYFLFGVFDGHGGPEVAEFMKLHFEQSLLLNSAFQSGQYQKALSETFQKMDELLNENEGRKQIYSIIANHISKGNRDNFDIAYDDNAGCTANVCLITDSEIYVANAGDSRAVASTKDGIVPLSFDHKPLNVLEEKRIKQAEGFIVKDRVNGVLSTSRSIGDLFLKKNSSLPPSSQIIVSTPDVTKYKRDRINFIIMGCDGVWEQKANEAMIQWIASRLAKKMEPTAILSELFDQESAQKQSGNFSKDNMSAILIVFKQ